MDIRSEFPRFSSENITADMPMVDFLRQLLKKSMRHRLNFRWLGCSRKSRSLVRFPALEAAISCTRT